VGTGGGNGNNGRSEMGGDGIEIRRVDLDVGCSLGPFSIHQTHQTRRMNDTYIVGVTCTLSTYCIPANTGSIHKRHASL
jgi:hypothetical protein